MGTRCRCLSSHYINPEGGCMIGCCATRFWVAEDGRCFAPRAHLRRCPRLTTSCPCRGKSHPASSPAVVRASFHSPLHRLASPRKVSRRAPSRSCRGAWKGDRDASGMEMVAVRASFHSPLHRRAFSMLRGLSKIIFSRGRCMAIR